jgi:hypothetical protein
LGADSSVTLAAGRAPTIEQPTREKIQIITNDVLLAGTGQVGMGQRFKFEVEQHRDYLKDPHAINGVRRLCHAATENFISTNAEKGQYGAILAFYANGTFHLCEFGIADFQPELKTMENWFVSMGCGQPIADPFLALLHKIFWKNKPPKVNEAVFAVTWVLSHAIEVNPGGINGPVRLAMLTKPDRNVEARFLDDDELQEHQNNVQGIEKYLQQYGREPPGPAAEAPSPPPGPPAPPST